MPIYVKIKVGATSSTSSVTAVGSDYHIITDSERNTFGIASDDDLKNAVGKYYGKNPSDAYLQSPTPWNDLYKTFGWPQVQTVLTVHSSTITETISQPVILATKTFTNNSNCIATFNADISEQVFNTIDSNWYNSCTVSFSQSVSYGISFLGTSGGESSFLYDQAWGQRTSKNQTVNVGSDTGVTVTLNPGESVVANLTANRGLMKIRILYSATLSGVAAVNYNPTYKDHQFWGIDIIGIVRTTTRPTTVQIVEDIEIGYYSNSEIIITDKYGQRKSTFNVLPGIEGFVGRTAQDIFTQI